MQMCSEALLGFDISSIFFQDRDTARPVHNGYRSCNMGTSLLLQLVLLPSNMLLSARMTQVSQIQALGTVCQLELQSPHARSRILGFVDFQKNLVPDMPLGKKINPEKCV